MVQWNLLTMTFDMQYFLDDRIIELEIVMNKNQTLLALYINYYKDKHRFYVFSMKTGTLISEYG